MLKQCWIRNAEEILKTTVKYDNGIQVYERREIEKRNRE